ncbi:MAG: TIGR02147 family protein [Persicimonas sp.]
MAEWKPDIWAYLDYRAFLRDYYEAAKQNVSAFSYRYFARKAGLSSPSFLRHVIRGERNIGDTIDEFARGLELDDEEARFFELLVEFDQAESTDSKNQAFEKLAATRRFRQARRIDRGMFEYLSHWYYPAIREMVARPDFRDDPDWIAAELMPAIEPEQAKEALETLLDLGLVTRHRDGHLVRGEPSVTTGHEVRSLAIGNYHRQMLERAGESIERVPRDLRDLGAMTVCISKHTATDIKQRIHEFREIIFELCDADLCPEVVFQFNTQLFPMSRLPARIEPDADET